MKGELPPLASRNIARDYVYVDDVTEAYVKAAETPSQELGAIDNVGAGVQTALDMVVEIARPQLQIKAKPKWDTMPNRSRDSTEWLSDSTNIERALGWKARHDFEEGFSCIVAWLRREPAIVSIYGKRASSNCEASSSGTR